MLFLGIEDGGGVGSHGADGLEGDRHEGDKEDDDSGHGKDPPVEGYAVAEGFEVEMIHHPIGNGRGDDEGYQHQFHEGTGQLSLQKLPLGSEHTAHGHGVAFLLHIVGTHGQESEGADQQYEQGEECHETAEARLGGEEFGYFVVEVDGVEDVVGEELGDDGFDSFVGLAVVAGVLYEDGPRRALRGEFAVVIDEGLFVVGEDVIEFEVFVVSADGHGLLFKSQDFGIEGEAELFHGEFVQPPVPRIVVVVQGLETEHVEVVAVALDNLERGHLPVGGVHGVVVGAAEGGALAESHVLDAGFLQKAFAQGQQVGGTAIVVVETEDVVGVVAEGGIDDMVHLEEHGEGSDKHNDGHDVLQDDEDFAVDLLCFGAEGTANHLDGLCPLDDEGGDNASHEAGEQHEGSSQQDARQGDALEDGKRIVEHAAGGRREGFGQQDSQQHGHGAHEGAFGYHLQRHTPASGSQQAAGGHLFGTAAAEGGGEVDIIKQREGQQHQTHGGSQRHKAAAAGIDAHGEGAFVVVEEVDVEQRDEVDFLAFTVFVRPVDFFHETEQVVLLGGEVGPGAGHDKGEAEAAITHLLVVKGIVVDAVFAADDDIGLLEGAVAEVVEDGGNGQLGEVAGIAVSEGFAHGALAGEMGVGKLAANGAAVVGGFPFGHAAFDQGVGEDVEKVDVGVGHIGVYGLLARADIEGRLFVVSPTGGGLYLGVAVFEVIVEPVGRNKVLVVAHKVDAVGILLEVVGGALPLHVDGQQQHEGHGESEANQVDGGIELVAREEFEVTVHIVDVLFVFVWVNL